ncbi:MAG: hypothetical protein HY670_10415 [Chloroflexi bacterium]|nr:hypothetical protein [Chloroflexota bacterium]
MLKQREPLDIRQSVSRTIREFEKRTGLYVDRDAEEFLVSEALKKVDLLQTKDAGEVKEGMAAALEQLLGAASRTLASPRDRIGQRAVETAKQNVCPKLSWPWSEIFC